MSIKKQVTVAILAGGLGTRLRDAVPDKPKSIAEINGRPFITYLLKQIRSSGLKNVIICSGYLSSQIEEEIGYEFEDMDIEYSVESSPLGTGGALGLALPMLHTNYLMVMNGDSYVDIDLNSFCRWFNDGNFEAALCMIKKNNTRRYGRLALSPENRIEEFLEKTESEFPGYINAGVYLFQKKDLGQIPVGIEYSLEKSFLPSLIDEGLFGYHCRARFIDIGTPKSYEEASEFFEKVIE